MRRIVPALLLSVVAATAIASPAAAALPKAVVDVPYCYTYNASAATVPVGTKVVLHTAWLTKTRAQISDFLNNTKLKVTVNGTVLSSTRSHWGAAYYSTRSKGWVIEWNYAQGTLAHGHQMVLLMALTFTRTISDGFTTYPKGTTNYDCVATGD